MVDARKDWADEDRPADMGRRRFLQGTLMAGGVAFVGTAMAGVKSFLPPPVPLCAEVEDTFRFGLPENPRDWVVQRNLVGQTAKVTDFHLWDGASCIWRQCFDEGGKTIPGTGYPALIICVEDRLLQLPPELDPYVIRREVDGVPAAFVVLYDRCVHFCCKPGWHVQAVPEGYRGDAWVARPGTQDATDPVTGLPNPQDPIWCPCHNSQYDPVTLKNDIHPPPAPVSYIGARYVHGPASRSLPCIPAKLSGTKLMGIYDPENGGHPEWYSAYCR